MSVSELKPAQIDKTVWKWTCELELHVGSGQLLGDVSDLRNPSRTLGAVRYTRDVAQATWAVDGGMPRACACQWGPGAVHAMSRSHCYLDIDQGRTGWGQGGLWGHPNASLLPRKGKQQRQVR